MSGKHNDAFHHWCNVDETWTDEEDDDETRADEGDDDDGVDATPGAAFGDDVSTPPDRDVEQT